MTGVLSDELVAQRLSELEDLCTLGETLLGARLPPIERHVLRARSIVIEGVEADEPGRLRLRIGACGARRDLGWTADVVIDPASGRVLASAHAVLVAIERAGVRADALLRGEAGVITVQFPMEPAPVIDASPAHPLWLCRRADVDRTSWPAGGGRARR